MTEVEHRRGSDTRERILIEAEKLYHSGGYDKISLQEVADALGIKKPALFYHYKSKQDLFFAMALAMMERMTSAISNAIAASDGTVRSKLFHILDYMNREPSFDLTHFLKVDFENLSPAQRQQMEQIWLQKMLQPTHQIFEIGVQSGELKKHNTEMASYMYLNLWTMLPRSDNPLTHFDPQHDTTARFIGEMLDLFLGNIALTE